MKKQILTFIAVFAIFYLMWSFYHVSFDVSKWGDKGRYYYLFISSIVSSFIFVSNKIFKP